MSSLVRDLKGQFMIFSDKVRVRSLKGNRAVDVSKTRTFDPVGDETLEKKLVEEEHQHRSKNSCAESQLHCQDVPQKKLGVQQQNSG